MVALAIALGISSDQLTLEASDEASINQRTFELQTRADDDKTHALIWDFLAPENQEDMLMVECQHFLDCLKSRGKPHTDGWHGVKTIQALENIHPKQRR